MIFVKDAGYRFSSAFLEYTIVFVSRFTSSTEEQFSSKSIVYVAAPAGREEIVKSRRMAARQEKSFFFMELFPPICYDNTDSIAKGAFHAPYI